MEEARAALAASGTLRAAINLGNPLLVSEQQRGDAIDGVAPAMARAVAAELDVAFQLLPYPSAGAVAESAGSGAWDIGLIADDPARTGISFTPPYVEIPATYMVQRGSGLSSTDAVDAAGVTIVAVERSAYALWLAAHLTRATLVEVPDGDRARDLFVAGGVVLAGLASTLHDTARELSDATVLPGQFMGVQQAIGTSAGNPVGAAFLQAFVEDARASKLPATLIAQFGLESSLIPSGET